LLSLIGFKGSKMLKEISDNIGFVANFAAILTAIIAVFFFYKTQMRNYYVNSVPGIYKIFSSLKGSEKSTALYQIEISFVSTNGWFFGVLKYAEVSKPTGQGSGGLSSVFGKISYSFFRIIIGYLLRAIKFKKFNPLEANDVSSFHGKVYLLSRNDLDISKRNWKEMIVQEYSIIHYKDAHRFKLYNPQKESYLQLPDELVLININKIPDPILNMTIGF